MTDAPSLTGDALDRLSPCPFCGGTSLSSEPEMPEVCDGYVQCNTCDAMVQSANYRADWNRRAPPSDAGGRAEGERVAGDASALLAWIEASLSTGFLPDGQRRQLGVLCDKLADSLVPGASSTLRAPIPPEGGSAGALRADLATILNSITTRKGGFGYGKLMAAFQRIEDALAAAPPAPTPSPEAGALRDWLAQVHWRTRCQLAIEAHPAGCGPAPTFLPFAEIDTKNRVECYTHADAFLAAHQPPVATEPSDDEHTPALGQLVAWAESLPEGSQRRIGVRLARYVCQHQPPVGGETERLREAAKEVLGAAEYEDDLFVAINIPAMFDALQVLRAALATGSEGAGS